MPLTVLGSSLFCAKLAAAYGLPYAFASHFAPDALAEAVAPYRARVQPSEQFAEPHVVAAVTVIAADRAENARAQLAAARRERVRATVGRGRELSEAEPDMVMDSPAGQRVLHMMHWSTAGTGAEGRSWPEGFAATADADELMIAPTSPGEDEALRTLEILAGCWADKAVQGLPPRASRR